MPAETGRQWLQWPTRLGWTVILVSCTVGWVPLAFATPWWWTFLACAWFVALGLYGVRSYRRYLDRLDQAEN
jgi:hypothetical protein